MAIRQHRQRIHPAAMTFESRRLSAALEVPKPDGSVRRAGARRPSGSTASAHTALLWPSSLTARAGARGSGATSEWSAFVPAAGQQCKTAPFPPGLIKRPWSWGSNCRLSRPQIPRLATTSGGSDPAPRFARTARNLRSATAGFQAH